MFFVFCYPWSCLIETCIFLVCFCYWSNSFMKGDEGGISNNFPDRKPLFLFKIKVKQNPGYPNKEYNVVFKHFHQNIRAYHRIKQIYIDQLLVKYCILAGIWATGGVGEQVWFVPNTSGRSRGIATPEKFCRFWN